MRRLLQQLFLGRAWLLAVLRAWQGHRLQVHAGALAFFGLLALGPMAFALMRLLRWSLGAEAAQALTHAPIRELLGAPAARSFAEMLQGAPAGRSLGAALFGLSTFGMGMLGIFTSLRTACETIWHTQPERRVQGRARLGLRVLGMASIACLGFLLIVSLFATAAISASLHRLPWTLGSAAIAVDALLSWLLLTGLCAAMLRTLPDVSLRWADVWRAAACMALLLSLGKWCIGLYLTQDDVSGQYGTAGTLATLLIWVYYAAQALLLGAVLAHGRANRQAPSGLHAQGRLGRLFCRQGG